MKQKSIREGVGLSPLNENYENYEKSSNAEGEFSCFSYLRNAKGPPQFDESMLHGPAGAAVRAILPHTEAHIVALYIQLLTGLGNLIGPSPFFLVGSKQHRANLVCGGCWPHVYGP